MKHERKAMTKVVACLLLSTLSLTGCEHAQKGYAQFTCDFFGCAKQPNQVTASFVSVVFNDADTPDEQTFTSEMTNIIAYTPVGSLLRAYTAPMDSYETVTLVTEQLVTREMKNNPKELIASILPSVVKPPLSKATEEVDYASVNKRVRNDIATTLGGRNGSPDVTLIFSGLILDRKKGYSLRCLSGNSGRKLVEHLSRSGKLTETWLMEREVEVFFTRQAITVEKMQLPQFQVQKKNCNDLSNVSSYALQTYVNLHNVTSKRNNNARFEYLSNTFPSMGTKGGQ